MSPTTSAMDRKVRRTLLFVGILLLIPVILAVRNYVASTRESKVLASTGPTDERLVVIDGDTMIVAPAALGQTMTSWLQSRKAKTITFELSDHSFQPNSATPSDLTKTRMNQVAALTKASPTLIIHVLEPAEFQSEAIERLDDQRALRLRDGLVARGVPKSRVVIEQEKEEQPAATSHLAVLLSK
jgi:hypothetical protein